MISYGSIGVSHKRGNITHKVKNIQKKKYFTFPYVLQPFPHFICQNFLTC